MRPDMEGGSHVGSPQLAKWADYTAKLVVRGGIEPPAFRFSAGFPGLSESIAGHLIRPNDAPVLFGIRDQPYVSKAVVSKALARSTDGKRYARGLPVAEVSSGKEELRGGALFESPRHRPTVAAAKPASRRENGVTK